MGYAHATTVALQRPGPARPRHLTTHRALTARDRSRPGNRQPGPPAAPHACQNDPSPVRVRLAAGFRHPGPPHACQDPQIGPTTAHGSPLGPEWPTGGRAGGVTVDLVQLSLTVASGRRRQRYTTAGTTQLSLTVASGRRRQRYTTARTTRLPLTVASGRRRQRYTTARTTQLPLTVASGRRRQRYTTAGSGRRTGRPLGAAEAAVPRSQEVRAHGTTPLKCTMSALIKQMRHAVLPGSAVVYLMGVVRGGTPLTSRHWLCQRCVTARA
jgi:hypothetical protein